MIRNTSALTISSFSSMFFVGVAATIVGAAGQNIGITPYEIGLLLAAQNLGFVISVAISGALADTYSKPRILFVGSIIFAFSFLTFYLTELIIVNLLVIFFIGIGMGTYEGVTDPMLLEIHKTRLSLYISVNHFFVNFGSLAITLYLVFMQMNWRKSATQSGIAIAFLALFFVFAKLNGKEKAIHISPGRLKKIWSDRVVVLLFVVVLCAMGIELGCIGVMTSFLMELRGFSQVTSKMGLLIFSGGIAIGRLAIGFFMKKKLIFKSILILFLFLTVCLSALYFIHVNRLTYAILFLTGICLSAILPLTLTLAGLLYEEVSGTVLGFLKLAIPFGGILIPFFLSILSKYTSFQASLTIFPAVSATGFFILSVNRTKFRSHIF